MKALTIRQPWAWLIVTGLKDIENRTWRTHHRGPLLIHAGAKLDATPIQEIEYYHDVTIDRCALQFGGLIGVADVVDCVEESDSPWFHGPFGFVLRNIRAIEFTPLRGGQGLFDAEPPPSLRRSSGIGRRKAR